MPCIEQPLADPRPPAGWVAPLGWLAFVCALAGCSNAPAPASPPAGPATAPARLAPHRRRAPLPAPGARAAGPSRATGPAPPRATPPAAPRNASELRLQFAKRLVAAHPDTSYTARAPDRCWPSRCWRWSSTPTAACAASRCCAARRARHDAAGHRRRAAGRAVWRVSRLPKPWKFIETFLFDDDGASSRARSTLRRTRHNGRMFFTIPTLLTWARIIAIPLIVGVFYLPLDAATRNLIATVLFVVFALTDWLDGWLARKLNQTSSFGAFLDPVADKFLVCASLLVLVQLDRVDALVALIIIGREIAISALREWMAQIGASRSVAVHMLGKLKTVAQMVAIPFLLYDGALFGVIDTRLWGTVPDLHRLRADDLVDGLLHAQGHARDPRQGAMNARRCRGPARRPCCAPCRGSSC